MDTSEAHSHLSQIETRWTEMFEVHLGRPDAAAAAQAALMLRYAGAVLRYLVKATGDPHLAEDLAQDFAVRFLRGDFRNADRSKGRRRRAHPRPLEPGASEPATPGSDLATTDRPFLDSWREEIMAHAWDALARYEAQTGRPYHTVLRFRADHPDLHSPRMAELLAGRLGRPVTAVWTRQMLFRAREVFVDLVIAEVAHTVERPIRERVEQELIDLDLLEYCRSGLNRYQYAT